MSTQTFSYSSPFERRPRSSFQAPHWRTGRGTWAIRLSHEGGLKGFRLGSCSSVEAVSRLMIDPLRGAIGIRPIPMRDVIFSGRHSKGRERALYFEFPQSAVPSKAENAYGNLEQRQLNYAGAGKPFPVSSKKRLPALEKMRNRHHGNGRHLCNHRAIFQSPL
jgi:hypothetical protein